MTTKKRLTNLDKRVTLVRVVGRKNKAKQQMKQHRVYFITV